MEVLKNLPYELTIDVVITELKMRHISSQIKEIVKDVLKKATDIARPKAVYEQFYIDEISENSVVVNGIEFKSHILSKNVENVGKVFPYVVTAGQELEKIDVDEGDMFSSYILDLIKELILSKARESFEKILFKNVNIEKGSYMSPGSLNDWPISEQKKLFDLLGDVEKAIGVKLLPTFIMEPVKTVSGIYFPAEFDFDSCMLCLRENCPSRKAAFNPGLYEEYTGKKV